jgi:hypothetical protein
MLPLRAALSGPLLLALALAGCSGPVAPRSAAAPSQPAASAAAREPRLFYPLDLGNHWRFHRVLSTQGQVVRRSRIDHDLVCVDGIGGRAYVVDRLTQTDSTVVGPLTYHQWVRSRQDPSGLYEADVDIGTPPPCDPGTVLAEPPPLDAALLDPGPGGDAAREAVARVQRIEELLMGRRSTAADGELTRLRYPLVVGRTWTVRSAPIAFSSTVEALEVLSLPFGPVQAYRIRTDAEVAGPRDRVVTWYGRGGMLGMFVHVEIDTANGPFIAEDIITLEDLDLDRGRF